MIEFFLASSSSLSHSFALFFALVIGHAVGDYPLQSRFMATYKSRHTPPPNEYEGERPRGLWVYCLTAHCLVHGGAVWLIVNEFGYDGAVWFALAETLLHWGLDFAKCERWTNFHQDQGLHIVCKAAYVFALSG
jgi:hypothetical protein